MAFQASFGAGFTAAAAWQWDMSCGAAHAILCLLTITARSTLWLSGLVSQGWVHDASMSDRQAIAIGKGILDGIGCAAGQASSIELEEEPPNFY